MVSDVYDAYDVYDVYVQVYIQSKQVLSLGLHGVSGKYPLEV